jgi:heme/copper-type cytochrome/quinol oxidase subunit 1
MLSVKLFATLAILQVGLALLENTAYSKSIDVHLHATYFVVADIHVLGLMALASSCFALVYLAASRWVLHPLNNSLGITHFVLALTGFLLLFLALFSIKSGTANGEPVGRVLNHWQFLAFVVGGICFLLGCATLAVNCAWTAIAAFRSQ